MRSPELISTSDIVNFINREMLVFEAFSYDFTVMINKTGSSEIRSPCSKNATNIVAVQRYPDVNTLNINGFCL